MPIIVEPDDSVYEREWRLMFTVQNPEGPHVTFSGRVNLTEKLDPSLDIDVDMVEGTSDEKYRWYEVRLVVGPYFKGVQEVVPFVTLTAFENSNADEDNEQGWRIEGLTWDTVVHGMFEAHGDEERIRLKFKVAVKGENSTIGSIGYYVTARARRLGLDGLDTPPAHKQGSAPT